jgi:hypothetical protein
MYISISCYLIKEIKEFEVHQIDINYRCTNNIISKSESYNTIYFERQLTFLTIKLCSIFKFTLSPAKIQFRSSVVQFTYLNKKYFNL